MITHTPQTTLQATTPIISRLQRLDEILERCARAADVPVDELKSHCRRSELVLARHLYSLMARRETNLTAREIGQHINRRHSSISYASATAQSWLSIGDAEFTALYARYMEMRKGVRSNNIY